MKKIISFGIIALGAVLAFRKKVDLGLISYYFSAGVKTEGKLDNGIFYVWIKVPVEITNKNSVESDIFVAGDLYYGTEYVASLVSPVNEGQNATIVAEENITYSSFLNVLGSETGPRFLRFVGLINVDTHEIPFDVSLELNPNL